MNKSLTAHEAFHQTRRVINKKRNNIDIDVHIKRIDALIRVAIDNGQTQIQAFDKYVDQYGNKHKIVCQLKIDAIEKYYNDLQYSVECVSRYVFWKTYYLGW